MNHPGLFRCLCGVTIYGEGPVYETNGAAHVCEGEPAPSVPADGAGGSTDGPHTANLAVAGAGAKMILKKRAEHLRFAAHEGSGRLPETDGEYDRGQLAAVAAAYAAEAAHRALTGQPGGREEDRKVRVLRERVANGWTDAYPFPSHYDRRASASTVELLASAGAYCAAEIDRILSQHPELATRVDGGEAGE